MKDKFWFVFNVAVVLQMILCISSSSYASNRRIYCKPNSIIIEHRVDEDYTEENKMNDFQWFVIDEAQIPQYEYPEQLRCSGRSLTVDHNFKPERVVRQEQIRQAKDALDAELGKAEPDVITVLRLQRAIEKMKEDRGKPMGQ